MRSPLKLLPVLVLTLLAACATGFNADVKRFQALPAPAGQAFYIQPGERTQGGLEFATYAASVSQRLSALGFRPAASPRDATLLVRVDYGVDKGREKIQSTPGFGGYGGYGGFGYGGGFPYYYRSNGRFVRPFGYGWVDPFWAGPWGGGEQITSYTVYDSFLDMRIVRTADNQSVFEGHAEARTPTNDLTRLVPNLVAAMFTDFPGAGGTSQRVTVPKPEARR